MADMAFNGGPQLVGASEKMSCGELRRKTKGFPLCSIDQYHGHCGSDGHEESIKSKTNLKWISSPNIGSIIAIDTQ